MKIAAVVTAASLALGLSGAGTAQAQEAFAPRAPSSLIDVLEAMDARAELDGMENGQVRLNVITPGGIFGAEFIGCDDRGEACKALGEDTIQGCEVQARKYCAGGGRPQRGKLDSRASGWLRILGAI